MNRSRMYLGWRGSRVALLALAVFLGIGPLVMLVRVAAATPDRQNAPVSGSALELLFASPDTRHSQAVAWGDIEGDGDLDLYVGNGIYPQWISWLDYTPYNPTDQVYINNGRGRFTLRDIADEPADGGDTRGVAWGDVDGDGDLDVAVANGGEASGPQPNRVYENVGGVLRYGDGEEGAGWQSAERYMSSCTGWGDWDGDGDLDLAYGNEDAPNQVYENISGTLQFDPANGIGWAAPAAYQTSSLAWGDWDGDGDLDLAFGNYNDGPALQLYENISGTLQLDPGQQMGWRSDASAPIQAIAWGDWDGDGDLDLAAGGGDRWHVADALLQLWENPNDGGLVWKEDATAPAALDKPAGLAWADWDRDGDLDLIAANNRGGGWGRPNQVYENDGGALRLSPQNGLGWQSELAANLNSETTYAVAAGDGDGDGDLDLAFANGGLENGGQANVIYQNTATVIGFARPAWQSADARAASSAAWGDVDGDGDLDLAVTNEFAPVVVHENVVGTLSLDPAAGLGWAAPITPTVAADAAWGDVDGDGDLDLAVANDGAPDLVYENEAGQLALDPAAGLGWQTPISDTSRTRAVAWGDWDGDGDLDLALGRADAPAQVYENVGGALQLDPAAGLGWESAAALSAEDVAWGDWDDDGDLDLALGARVFVNDAGRLLFDPANGVGWDSGFPATTVAWGDSDGDGDLDLAAGSITRARVYENLGGRLEFNPVSGTGWQSFEIFQVRGVAWGDADGDGDLDLATASDANWGFEPNRVFENVDGELSTTAVWATTDERETGGILRQAQDVAWGDVDGDGDLDLAFANTCTGNDCDARGRPTQVYLNTLQTAAASLPAQAVPLLSVSDPDVTAAANFYASPQIVSSNAINIPYRLADPSSVPAGRVEMFYSLDGGDNWRQGRPTADTATTNLATSAAGTEHVFGWDTFGSDFFGRSDNVTIRLIVYQTPPTRDVAAAGAYLYFNSVAGSFQRPAAAAVTFPFRVQSTQVRVVNESGAPVEGAWVYRLPAGQSDGALLMPEAARPQMTNAEGVLPGGGEIQPGDRLMALVPAAENPVAFSNKVRLFYTSGAPTESGLDMVAFDQPGIVELSIISTTNPLLLFDLDVSLEWDARNDATFQTELTNSFQRASEILYDVTNGQAALGVVQVFQDKEYWSQADVVVLANNSLRPSAAIGGVAKLPMPETVLTTLGDTRVISNAYSGGQIRMGTVWDPFGENTAELGEEWWRALAHELAHYLLFLPDNYLGFKDSGVLGRINCQGSFMTSTYDPAYSEFLTDAQWAGVCLDSLAEKTTGRSDWETIRAFYDELAAPASSFEGPVVQSLDLTDVIFYAPEETRTALRARNFDVRDADGERMRLPSAQAYLFQTQGTPDPTDDMILQLGTPTGGGDRLKVRGAFPGDRLCLIDSSAGQAYIGCDDDLQLGDVSIRMQPMPPAWQPQIEAGSVTSRTVQITVTQPLSPGQSLQAQLFPLHYGAAPGLAGRAPTAALQTAGIDHTATLTMSLPAYEVVVRVWVEGDGAREAISQFHLNPPWPTGGPNSPAIGGPNSPAIGGPNSPAIGGPNSPAIGGPNSPAIGGPNSPAIGGPNSPAIGGPNSPAIGGPNSPAIGGPNSPAIGGPNSSAIGGPNSPAIGGPNSPAIGGADRSFNAPIMSADAQVVVYSAGGYFEENGIDTLQQLGRVPELATHPWLMPVGQAYAVTLDPAVTSERIIGFNYLQREVPAGYEHTLAIYFLPDGRADWQRLETIRYVENLVVAPLEDGNGVYAVMSTVVMPQLVPGWNLVLYPLPDARAVTETLASLGDRVTIVYESESAGELPPDTAATNVAQFEFAHAYWLWLAGDEPATLYLAPPRPSPDGVVPGS